MSHKRRILLIGADHEARSVQAFILTTNGYAVWQAESIAEAHRIVVEELPIVDLIIALWPLPEKSYIDLASRVTTPILLIVKRDRPSLFSATTVAIRPSGVELLELVHRMSARKRGPHKGIFRKHLTPQPASVLA